MIEGDYVKKEPLVTDIVDRLTYRAENLWAEVRPHAAVLDLEAAAEILRLRERVFELESERAEDHSTT